MRRIRIFAVAVAVLAAACGKAPTEVVENRSPTPIPALTVDVAGLWTGLMGSQGVVVTVTQEAERVEATWSTPTGGNYEFDGTFQPYTTTPVLSGTVKFGHPTCEVSSVRVTGQPTTTQMLLKGYALCRFDVMQFSLDLSRPPR